MAKVASLRTENKYKKTEIGEIPVDWEVSTINSIGLLGRGRVISQKEIASHPGNYPVFSSQSKSQGILGYLDTYDFEGEYVTWTTDGAYAGTVFHRNGRFSCTNVCGTIKAKDEHLIDMQFLSYAISTRTKRYVSYVGNPKLMNNAMAEVSFVRPPLAEQKKLAEILSTVDAAIEKIAEVIEKTKLLKKCLMHELLTRGIGHKKFKKTAFGEIPEEWGIIRLADISTIRYGLGQPPQLHPDGVPMIRATNIKSGRIVKEGLIRIQKEAIPPHRNPYLSKGEIIVVRSGAYTGDIALIREEWVGAIAGYDLIVSLHGGDDPVFYTNYLLSPITQRFFASQKDRSAQPHLNEKQLANTPVPKLPVSEQHEIAEILSLADEELEKRILQKRNLGNLKKGLMQVLLTGRTRVKC